MIETTCMCGASLRAAEAQANQQTRCAQCGATTVFVAAEQLADGAGAADFDTALVLPFAAEDGSVQTWQFFLGGVAEIQIGKLAEKHIVLGGPKVSRSHCRLGRLDFGPSRWKVIDNRSTNGTIVNDERIAEHE